MESLNIKAKILKFLPLVGLFLVVYLIAGFFLPKQLGTESYADLTKPEASINKRTDTLFISATDNLSGIAKISMQLKQNDQLVFEKELLKENRDRETEYFNIPFISLKNQAKEGPATIVITATDDSIWGNSVTVSSEVTFDFQPPTLAIRSTQHRMFAGGAELIIFEASDNQSLESAYIDLQDGRRFYAVNLATADERFKERPNLYAVLFAVERGFEELNFKPLLTAVDSTGNITSTPLSLTFVPKPLKVSQPVLSDKFLAQKIPPLIEEMRVGGLIDQNSNFFNTDGFAQVNEVYRRDSGLKLTKLLTKTEITPIIPKGPFARPMAGTLTSKFGEARKYFHNGSHISNSTHDGQDIASVRRDSVTATAAGEVIMARSFGIYGQTILIDHGLGISSLYGHLSSMAVTVGDKVERGQKIGKSGTTGLAGGDHLHFEIRIQNVPVTPIEWWDQKWYNDNIRIKLEDPELLR